MYNHAEACSIAVSCCIIKDSLGQDYEGSHRGILVGVDVIEKTQLFYYVNIFLVNTAYEKAKENNEDLQK